METINKKWYDAPALMVVDVKLEGVLCYSLTNPDDYPGGGDPFNPTNIP